MGHQLLLLCLVQKSFYLSLDAKVSNLRLTAPVNMNSPPRWLAIHSKINKATLITLDSEDDKKYNQGLQKS